MSRKWGQLSWGCWMWSCHHRKWENELTRETCQGRRASWCPRRGWWSRVVSSILTAMLTGRAQQRVKQGAGFALASAMGRCGVRRLGCWRGWSLNDGPRIRRETYGGGAGGWKKVTELVTEQSREGRRWSWNMPAGEPRRDADSRDLEWDCGKDGGLKQKMMGDEAEKGLRGQESSTYTPNLPEGMAGPELEREPWALGRKSTVTKTRGAWPRREGRGWDSRGVVETRGAWLRHEPPEGSVTIFFLCRMR